VKKDIKVVTFKEHESSSPPPPEERNIRKANRTAFESPSKSLKTTLESRVTELEDQQQEHAYLLKDIIKNLQEPERQMRGRLTGKEQRCKYQSESNSEYPLPSE
jgi:hypothetical protein